MFGGDASAAVQERAADLVRMGAVKVVTDYGDGRVVASVGGYRVVRNMHGRMVCECAAAIYGRLCSHVVALDTFLAASPR